MHKTSLYALEVKVHAHVSAQRRVLFYGLVPRQVQ